MAMRWEGHLCQSDVNRFLGKIERKPLIFQFFQVITGGSHLNVPVNFKHFEEDADPGRVCFQDVVGAAKSSPKGGRL